MASPAKEFARRFLAAALARLLRLRSRPLEDFAGPILVVSPHPDDETLGCGGLIARHATAGCAVAVAMLTDGEASHRDHPTLDSRVLASTRREEVRAAPAVLGARCAST